MGSKKTCPDCKGKKIIVGNCECNMEWRTTDRQDEMDDCICEPDQECQTCEGTGFIH